MDGVVMTGLVSVLLVSAWLSVSPTIALAGGFSPPSRDALRFATCVVLATTSGAVPVLTVLVI